MSFKGLVTKFMDYIEKAIGKTGSDWMTAALSPLGITQTHFQGRKSLDGNDARKILRETDKLEKAAASLPEESRDKVMAALRVMKSFDAVVESCFQNEIAGDYEAAIKEFCQLYRALPGITFPPKFHLVEAHIVPFLKRKADQG